MEVLKFCMIFVCITTVMYRNISGAGQCYLNQESFHTKCVQIMNGVTDGGRCYFLGNRIANWTLAWDVCRQQFGSILAQIHTMNEYQIIRTYVQTRGIVWISLRRNANSSGVPHAITMDTTFWYNPDLSPNQDLKAQNTWIRTRVNDDYQASGDPRESCFALWTNYLFYDAYCFEEYYPLCQITSPAQNYNMTDKCMLETPIETFPGQKPENCSDVCTLRSWCRSFNFRCDTKTCELFPWSIFDNPAAGANVTSGAGTSCYHYNYLP